MVGECDYCFDSMPIHRVPHHAVRRWQSARAVGTHMAYAESMGGLSPVPFGRWRDAWVDRRPRTLPSSRAVVLSAFRFWVVLYLADLEAAYITVTGGEVLRNTEVRRFGLNG